MLHIYTDGSSTGKVGEGGWAFVITKEGVSFYEASGGADDTTNNRMELGAVIEALRYMYTNYPTDELITLHSDSNYVVKGHNEWLVNWLKKIEKGKTIKNQDLWLDFKEISDLFSNLTIKWIKGHSGEVYNERCDVLAKAAKLEIKRNREELV